MAIDALSDLASERSARFAIKSDALDFVAQPILLLRTAPDAGDSTIAYANIAFCEHFGYAATDLIGRSPRLLHGPKTDRTRSAGLRAAIVAGRAATETLYLYDSAGTARLIEVRDRPLAASYRIVSLLDLTGAHETQIALERANERLRSLQARNYDAILTLDGAGRCIDANGAAESLFGRTRDALVDLAYGASARGAFFPSATSLSTVLEHGTSLEFSNELGTSDGRTIAVEWRAIPIVVGGESDGAYLIGRDVTAARASSAMLAEQARRTHALYLISAANETSNEKQIDAALRLMLATLGMESAYVGRVVGDAFQIRNVAGQAVVVVGDLLPLQTSLVQRCLAGGDVVVFDDVEREFARQPDGPRYPDWHGYLAAPLIIAGRVFGAIGVVGRKVRGFEANDRDFVRLVATLVAAALERQIQRERLDRLAFFDTLTGLANRAKIMRDIESAISYARRHGSSFALHSIDLDGFKAVNDRAGHATGDLALREVAERLTTTGRGYDVAARYGGDEFLFLQSDLDAPEDARALGGRIVAQLAEPYRLGEVTFDLGASLGIAIYPNDGDDAQTLLRNADLALYRAKENGKRRFATTDDLTAADAAAETAPRE